MRRCLLWLVGMTPALAIADPDGPIRWSPDGRWAAYTVVLRPDRPEAWTGWIDRQGPWREPSAQGAAESAPQPYRIYAIDRETGASALLEASKWPLSSPEWSSDGRALSFVRTSFGPDGKGKQDVVVQDGPTHQRILVSRPADAPLSAEAIVRHAPAWSSDGRFLAVPSVDGGIQLVILRADNGRVIKTINRATRPCWSPDGSRLVFRAEWVSGTPVLCLADTSFGAYQNLPETGPVDHAPAWTRDGKSLLYLIRRRRGPVMPVELSRFDLDTRLVEKLANLSAEPIGTETKVRGLSFGLDRESDELFWTVEVAGQPSVLVWFRLQTGETVNRFNPLDLSARIGSISVSPDGKTLALRFGPPGASAAVALYNTTTNKLTPVVPDDAARCDWLALLLDAGRDLVRLAAPPAALSGRGIPRPTAVLVPGELPFNHELAGRLHTIGRFGRQICERPADALPATADVERLLAEGRLLASTLLEDESSATAALDALEARTTSPDARLTLLIIRAQLLMGRGEWDRVADTLAYLRSIETRRPTQIEETPAGFVLADAPGPGWSSYLELRMADLRKGKAARGGVADIGHANPDAPEAPRVVLPNFAPPMFPGEDDPDVRVRFRPAPNRQDRAPAPPGPAPTPPPPRNRRTFPGR